MVAKKTLRNAVGISLLVAGGIGCVLPIIPGIPLLLAGAATLGADHPIVRTSRAWLARRGLWRRHFERDVDESKVTKS
jgi:uncharacterized protein YqgC (DUF456 family)